MNVPRRNQHRATLLLLLLSLGLAGLAAAQPMSLESPADSPLWWTVTPDLTPEQLRTAYLDPAGSHARYQAAVEAGLEQPLSREAMATLLWYDNPALTPELMPMWLAFDSFAMDYLRIDGENAMDSELTAFSISKAGRRAIFRAASRLAKEEADAIREVGPKQVKLANLQRAAIEKGVPETAVRRAARTKDKQFFSFVTGETREEVEALLAVYDTNPPAEASERALVSVREQLTDSDWDLLRSYLLKVIVAGSGPATDFR